METDNENIECETFIPEVDLNYVQCGNYDTIEKIVASKLFYPVFVTGLTGNGKTTMIEQVCANMKREYVRTNITIETDEDDLIGGFRLQDGNTVWHYGPVAIAMKRGAVLLLDEIDLASNKIMCLQPVLEGKPIFLKKIEETIHPAPGFNIIATANTKGRGSEDGKYIGTNLLNEAFLDRFPVTLFQDYPDASYERTILNKVAKNHDIEDKQFIDALIQWGRQIRNVANEGESDIDDVISTRRLVNIVVAYKIFGDKKKAIETSIERFPDFTKQTLLDFYSKIDEDFEKDVEYDSIIDDSEDMIELVDENKIN